MHTLAAAEASEGSCGLDPGLWPDLDSQSFQDPCRRLQEELTQKERCYAFLSWSGEKARAT